MANKQWTPDELKLLVIQKAKQYGIPEELALRQIGLESNFDPNAKSPTGPRGIAQFTKATGKAYGLEKEEDFYNPEKSLDAWGRHMKDLQGKYDSWDVTMLAYNQGEGEKGMSQIKALQSGNMDGVGTEGRNYVMKTAMNPIPVKMPNEPQPATQPTEGTSPVVEKNYYNFDNPTIDEGLIAKIMKETGVNREQAIARSQYLIGTTPMDKAASDKITADSAVTTGPLDFVKNLFTPKSDPHAISGIGTQIGADPNQTTATLNPQAKGANPYAAAAMAGMQALGESNKQRQMQPMQDFSTAVKYQPVFDYFNKPKRPKAR